MRYPLRVMHRENSLDKRTVMANKKKERIPVSYTTRAQLIEDSYRTLKEYEERYRMSSQEMAALMDKDEFPATLPATLEVIQWRHTFLVLTSLLKQTPTAGIPRKTVSSSTRAA